jgi:hypothetical protein
LFFAFFILRKIFSKKVEKNNEYDQKDYDKPIPLAPGFKYGNSIVVVVHLNLKIQFTNPKKK